MAIGIRDRGESVGVRETAPVLELVAIPCDGSAHMSRAAEDGRGDPLGRFGRRACADQMGIGGEDRVLGHLQGDFEHGEDRELGRFAGRAAQPVSTARRSARPGTPR